MSTLRTFREDFNRLVGEVESLKTEVRKKAHKVPLLEVWGGDRGESYGFGCDSICYLQIVWQLSGLIQDISWWFVNGKKSDLTIVSVCMYVLFSNSRVNLWG